MLLRDWTRDAIEASFLEARRGRLLVRYNRRSRIGVWHINATGRSGPLCKTPHQWAYTTTEKKEVLSATAEEVCQRCLAIDPSLATLFNTA